MVGQASPPPIAASAAIAPAQQQQPGMQAADGAQYRTGTGLAPAPLSDSSTPTNELSSPPTTTTTSHTHPISSLNSSSLVDLYCQPAATAAAAGLTAPSASRVSATSLPTTAATSDNRHDQSSAANLSNNKPHHHRHQRHQPAQSWRSSSSALAATRAAPHIASTRQQGVHQSIRLHRKGLLLAHQQERQTLTGSRQSLGAPTQSTGNNLASRFAQQSTQATSRISQRITITTSLASVSSAAIAGSSSPSSHRGSETSVAVREALVNSRRQQATNRATNQRPAISSAVTNSRVRQGALYARRQYHHPGENPQPAAAASNLPPPSRNRQHSISADHHHRQALSSSSLRFANLIRSTESSQSLSCINKTQQQAASAVNHSSRYRQSIAKTSSRLSLNSSTSSLTLAVVKRAKPSPQVNTNTARFEKHSPLDRSSLPIRTRTAPSSTRNTYRLHLGSNREAAIGSLELGTSNEAQINSRRAASSSSSAGGGSHRAGSRCATYLSAHRLSSGGSGSNRDNALATRKPAATRANSASANVNTPTASENDQADKDNRQIYSPTNIGNIASLTSNNDIDRSTTTNNKQQHRLISVKNNCLSSPTTEQQPSTNINDDARLFSRSVQLELPNRKSSVGAASFEASGGQDSSFNCDQKQSDKSNMISSDCASQTSGAGVNDTTINGLATTDGATTNNYAKQTMSSPLTTKSNQQTNIINKSPLGFHCSSNIDNMSTTSKPLPSAGNKFSTTNLEQPDSLEHAENMPPDLSERLHQEIAVTTGEQKSINCDQNKALIKGSSAGRETGDTDIVVDEQSNYSDTRSDAGSTDSRKTMDYQEEEDIKTIATTTTKVDERFSSSISMQRSDSLESNLTGSVEDHMVLGSPIVTPPPSELDIDVVVDDDNMIEKVSIGGNERSAKKSESQTVKLPNTIMRPVDIPIRTEPIDDYYDLEARPFARGKFAQVKRCISKTKEKCFAAKCIKKRRRSTDVRHEILLEIEALKLSYHTNRIVKLYEVYETPTEMILVLEMANGGELQRVLDDEEAIAEILVKRMVRQILDGLIQLHDSNIAHLDIKPQNLLLTETFPDGDIKLCDFGISRRITKDCEIREICGTPDYVAPEILRYDPISLATDMWSLGVLTYVLLSGYSPFGSESKQQTFCNITQAKLDFPNEIFDKISQDAIDFMQKLILRDPADRLTSRQARIHPWLSCH